jgi:thiosulfate/3-mercaptopyruvate sulfurtransferase
LAGREPSDTVIYCGSGVSAVPNLVALELAGLCGARLCAGSWSEWSRTSGRPVATGA